MKMKVAGLASAIALTIGMSGAASAMPFLSGSISFGPQVNTTWAFDGTCTTTANCNGFSLSPGSSNVVVVNALGNFSGEIGSVGTMSDVDIGALPVTPQWAVGSFTFDLLSASIVTVVRGSVEILSLSGSGLVSAAGFEDTAGVWSWTGTATSAGATTTFSFASSTSVPEPASLALLAIGLLGVGSAAGRARKA